MATGTDVKDALRFRSKVKTMLADPDLSGDLLLLAIALYDDVLDSPRSAGWQLRVCDGLGWQHWRITSAFYRDTPRYQPPLPETRGCTAAMVRREGSCGRSSNIDWEFDPATGVQIPVVLCTRHTNGAVRARIEAQRQAWEANGAPRPANNAGGVLMRYFKTDWDSMYAAFSPSYKRDRSKAPPEPPRPSLRLIRGGLEDN